MSDIKLSIFASAIRPALWKGFLDSLLSNTIPFEVIFAGPITPEITLPFHIKYPFFKYLTTKDIKPSQCYFVSFLKCQGELVHWSCDDSEYSPHLLDQVWKFFEFNNKHKILLSIKTNEDEKNNDLNDHRFFGWNLNTPFCAPLGVMNRLYLTQLGGLDRRYISGQWENEISCQVWEDEGKVLPFPEGCISIDHQKKHGNSTKFWSAYKHDRQILENNWVVGGWKEQPKPEIIWTGHTMAPRRPIINREVSRTRLRPHEPFENTDNLLTKSQYLPEEFKNLWE